MWRATRDGALVAIKILHLELIRSHDAIVRFERELRGDGTAATSPRRTRTRSRHARRRASVSRSRVHRGAEPARRHSRARLAAAGRDARDPRAALRGAACGAQLGLVHRDVKASNVILGHDAAGMRPVLLDFGLVKLLDQDGPGLTSSRSMLGTPAAMAPEQMKGQPVDARTDVYALGLLAYHMLTGAPAFGAPGRRAELPADPRAASASVEQGRHRSRDRRADRSRARAGSEAAFGERDASCSRACARSSSRPRSGGEQEVIALYVEGGPAELAQAAAIASNAGLTMALTAPDSLIAVAPRRRLDVRDVLRKARRDRARRRSPSVRHRRRSAAVSSTDLHSTSKAGRRIRSRRDSGSRRTLLIRASRCSSSRRDFPCAIARHFMILTTMESVLPRLLSLPASCCRAARIESDRRRRRAERDRRRIGCASNRLAIESTRVESARVESSSRANATRVERARSEHAADGADLLSTADGRDGLQLHRQLRDSRSASTIEADIPGRDRYDAARCSVHVQRTVTARSPAASASRRNGWTIELEQQGPGLGERVRVRARERARHRRRRSRCAVATRR